VQFPELGLFNQQLSAEEARLGKTLAAVPRRLPLDANPVSAIASLDEVGRTVIFNPGRSAGGEDG
jgi:hypothetical protein